MNVSMPRCHICARLSTAADSRQNPADLACRHIFLPLTESCRLKCSKEGTDFSAAASDAVSLG